MLRYNNIVFWIGIEKEHPVLQGYAAMTGSSYDTTGEVDRGIMIDWNSVLANTVSSTAESGNVLTPANTHILVAIFTMTIIPSIILLIYRFKIKK